MLHFYYSYARRSMFDGLFGGLDVCADGFAEKHAKTHNPALRNSMVVLHVSVPLLETDSLDASAAIDKYWTQLLQKMTTGVKAATNEYNAHRVAGDREMDVHVSLGFSSVSALGSQATVSGCLLLILIDEFDRGMVAAQRLCVAVSEADRTFDENVFKGVSLALSSLLSMLRAANARCVISGVFPVLAREWYVFSHAYNATHCQELAHTFGFDVEEVRELTAICCHGVLFCF